MVSLELDMNTICLVLVATLFAALYYCRRNKVFIFAHKSGCDTCGDARSENMQDSVPEHTKNGDQAEYMENVKKPVNGVSAVEAGGSNGIMISSKKSGQDHSKYNFDPTKIMPKMDNTDPHWKPALDLSDKNMLHYTREGPDSYSSRTLVKGTGITDIRGPSSTLLRNIHKSGGKSWYRPDSIDSNFTVADVTSVRGLHNEWDDKDGKQFHWGT